ncbi:MAG: chemotaxis protein CheD [Lachnospiraceae bacterium]|nr:chemotaxis protein CheD [Lachnospiraceae bacterium]
MSEMLKVGMADLKVCKSPDQLTTLGLGSCVGIAIRDPITRIGGLAHVMLPSSKQIKNNSNIYKFADTGIEELVRQMEVLGASRKRMVAKMAGGAQMFAFQNSSSMVRIGEQNVEASKAKLAELQIPLLASETGENYGRTVIFTPETGQFVIRAVGKPERSI